jgi:hypothetical protein
MPPTLRPLSFGEILDGAFSLYRRYFVVLYATALIPAIPLAALGGGVAYVLVRSTPGSALIWLGLVLLAPAAAMIMWGALQQQLSAAILGQPVSIGAGYRNGLRAAPYLWVQGVTLGILWFVFTLVSVLGVGAGALSVGSFGIIGGVLAVLIWIGGVGAGQLAFFALTFAAPAVVVLERLGPFAALGRSAELARNALPRTMGLIGVCGVIMLLPSIGLLFLTGIVSSGRTALEPPSLLQIALQQGGNLLVGSFTLPFLAACLSLLYYDRRVREEALDVRMMADTLPEPSPFPE